MTDCFWWCWYSSTEDFSYFTLRYSGTDSRPATSLFGISCTRQMDASLLLSRPADVTRSTVQKAVVVIADSPQYFGMLRERLGMVTKAWFAQRDFSDMEIISRFQESLVEEREKEIDLERKGEGVQDKDQYLGMSLRELVREFRWQTLVLFKCCLLQPKVCYSDQHVKYGFANGDISDALLWVEMRTLVHDAIFFDIVDTRFDSKFTRFCRSRVGEL